MNLWDILLLALILLAVVLALRSIRRRGVSCGGDCSRCARSCAGRQTPGREKDDGSGPPR